MVRFSPKLIGLGLGNAYSKYQILQVHRKDKDSINNKLENLELICLNCHAGKYYLKNSCLNNKQ